MSGDRHDMSDAAWEILRSVLSHKHQSPEWMHDRRVIGDRALDTDAVLGLIGKAGAAAVIPSRSIRKLPRPLDRETYRTRKFVDRYFGKTKEFCRIARRYDKIASNFLSAVCPTCIGLPAASCSAGSQTNYLIPQPRQIPP